MAQVVLPELGEGIEQATVSFWHIKEGQGVKQGDDLVEMSTDKSVFNVPASATGILKQQIVKEGDDVKVGAVLAIIA